jgi:hypothetical protein
MIDRFSKICLILIIALLAMIAFRPTLGLQTVHAQAVHPAKRQTMVVTFGPFFNPLQPELQDQLHSELNRELADGWELKAVVPVTGTERDSGYAVTKQLVVVFEK